MATLCKQIALNARSDEIAATIDGMMDHAVGYMKKALEAS